MIPAQKLPKEKLVVEEQGYEKAGKRRRESVFGRGPGGSSAGAGRFSNRKLETERVTTPIVKTGGALTRTLGGSFFLTLFIYWLHILLCTMAKC